MKKIKIIGIIVILIVLGFATRQLFSRRKTDNGKEYKTLQPTIATIVDEALAIGTITPENEIQVKSKIAGIVVERFVEVGDEVNKGDIMIQISPDPTPIELTETRRDLEMKEVALKNAKLQYDRNLELLGKNLVSEEQFESIKLRYDQAKLQRDLSKDRLSLIEKGQTGKVESVIKSPITGTVLEKFANIGDPVVPLTSYQQGTPLFTLADMTNLIFRGTIDEIDVGKVSVGVTAELEIGALPGKTILGEVIRMSPKARKENNATVFDIEIKIVDTRGINLRAGYSANAKIIINKVEDVISIPERLLTFENDSVFVEVEDTVTGTVIKHPVEIGLSDGIIAEVKSGVTIEDILVERPPKEIK
ncbi:MAG: efflux RND transporter periplasmic adaptor subunit [Candidatus Marinimicrobia bacterium]|jgi:HlyD family secretion protein|nr:efflux RND transporter periplasmic adaptor subunit [Candidatus Neomarinimicrobiota bacterium]MCK9484397.1 efflux RND transporter periplasmic adaptor subunit [Candidatus Neomarinimicrobiota bacterium]MCK9560558.1 efflux RND transporter periplasmic adaptor subunit [Candidatus Neomarinimicrobiota bacterium]MDD5540929.1 efflux RND transporter periplasmic adaptor subunit [Candidatus Neomarinimicrobiota bacterium]